MKKLIAVLMLVVVMLSMAACGKFTCDICGEEKSGKKYEEEILGVEVVYCKDCYEALEEAAEMLS